MRAHVPGERLSARRARWNRLAEGRITIEPVVSAFLNDEQGRHLKPAFLQQLRGFGQWHLSHECRLGLDQDFLFSIQSFCRDAAFLTGP